MINDIKDNSGSRLKEIRKYLDLTQIEFAKLLGISNGHVSDMEKERKNITEPMIQLLSLKFDVNENWLRTGKGEMFNKNNLISLDDFLKKQNATELEIRIMKLYFSLDIKTRKNIIDVFKNAINSESINSQSSQNKDNKLLNTKEYLNKEDKQIENEKISIIKQKTQQKPNIIRVPARGGYYEIEETEESIEALKRDDEKDFEYNPDYF